LQREPSQNPESADCQQKPSMNSLSNSQRGFVLLILAL
jgi:hypothetical protein